MRLNNIKSTQLLPQQSSNQGEASIEERLEWICSAFDTFVKSIDARRLALAAPYALEAIKKLTDEELQQYFREFDLATYYPDLPRASREMMLYEQLKNFRILGTKAAIQAMIQYLFGDNPISLEIMDNLAFDENGVLVNESLLNLYDAVVTIENPTLDKFQLSRIFANLTKFNRSSQKLRGISLRYETGDFNAYWGLNCLDTALFYDNGWINCDVPIIPYTITLGVDTYLPSIATNLTLDRLFWMYGFTGGSSYSNLWHPTEYADNLTPTNPDPSDSTIPSSYYANVWLWDGSSAYDMNGSGQTFRLATYSNKPEFYTNMSTACDAINSACLIELQEGSLVFGGVSTFSVPTSLYTRNGSNITWNTSHSLYQLLYGKVANVVY